MKRHLSSTVRSTLLDLGLIALIWLAAIALAGPVADVPLNDDWVYALAVKSILQTGSFALPSPSSANLFLQAYWGALFCLPAGFSFTALRLSTIVLGLAGVLSSYLIAREAGGGRRTAGVCALAVGLNPLYFVLSETFMTDVPFVAVSAAALWCFMVGMRKGGAWIATAFGLALASIMIRQFGFVFVGGFCIAYGVRTGWSRRSLAVFVALPVAAVAMHLLFQTWMVMTGRTPVLPMGSLGDLGAPSWQAAVYNLIQVLKLAPYVGLIAAPIFALHIQRVRLAREAKLRLATLALLAVGELVLIGFQFPAVKNVLTPFGFGPLTLKDTAFLGVNLPAPSGLLQGFWIVVTATTVLAAAAVFDLLFHTAWATGRTVWPPSRAPGPWLPALGLSLAGLFAVLMIALTLRWGIFDRYILVLAPALVMLIAAGAGGLPRPAADNRLGLALSIILLAGYGVFSVAGTRDYLEWNRARWSATAALTQMGVSPRQVDGGYEFNGLELYDPNYVRRPGVSYWWVVDDEFVVASGPLPGYRAVRSFPFRRWLTGRDANVVILRRESGN